MPLAEPPGQGPLVRALFRHSALYAHLRVAARRLALARGRDPVRDRWREELILFHRDGAGSLRHAVGETRRALEDLARVARDRGDRLVVVLAPPAFQVHAERASGTLEMVGLDPAGADLDAPRRALRDLLGGLGLEACDPTPALLAAADTGERLYFTYDGHWNERGHAVVGRELAACLAR